MGSPSTPESPARHARLAVLLAAVTLAAVLTVLSTRYGYHRDELYFRLLPPSWGYLDQPPLTPALARLSTGVADELWALRLPATLLAAGSVLVVALITREVGGDRLAQGIAAWGYAFGTMTLSFGHVLLTSSLDLVVWPVVLLAALRAVRRDPRWWLVAGAVVGLSTYNKWLITMLVISVLAGLALVGPRRALRSRWLLVSAGLAVLIALPNIGWQLSHGLPQLAMGGALSENNGTEVRISTIPMLLVMVGPLLVFCIVAGLFRLVRDPYWRDLRFVAVALAVCVGLTIAGGAQFYYPYGVLAVVFALGCVPVARYAQGSARRRSLVLGLVGLHVLTNTVISLPVLPEPVLAASPIPSLNQSVGDQVGWPAYVGQIDRVIDEAVRSDPAAVVLTSNYGQAGALDRFSRHQEIKVFSGHVALWDVASPPPGTQTVVVVGRQIRVLGDDFASCETLAQLTSGVAIDNEEEGSPVGICRGPRRSWAEIWPTLRHLG